MPRHLGSACVRMCTQTSPGHFGVSVCASPWLCVCLCVYTPTYRLPHVSWAPGWGPGHWGLQVLHEAAGARAQSRTQALGCSARGPGLAPSLSWPDAWPRGCGAGAGAIPGLAQIPGNKGPFPAWGSDGGSQQCTRLPAQGQPAGREPGAAPRRRLPGAPRPLPLGALCAGGQGGMSPVCRCRARDALCTTPPGLLQLGPSTRPGGGGLGVRRAVPPANYGHVPVVFTDVGAESGPSRGPA